MKKFTRALVCRADEVSVTDTFALENAADAVVTLFSIQPVRKLADGALDFGGGVRCELDGYACTGIAEMPLADIPRHWGDFMVRITLRAAASPARLVFRRG